MSELAKQARAKAKEKVARLTSADPHQKVDASDWTPPEALRADVKTGMRPVTRKRYKAGGSVEGEKEMRRADRKPRKAGGRAAWADEFVNRDLKEANTKREGYARTDGYKDGGRAKRAIGGPMTGMVPTQRMQFGAVSPGLLNKAALNRGGKAETHDDAAEDKKLVKGMVKPDALRAKRKHGGIAEITGTRPTGGREARADGGMVGMDGGHKKTNDKGKVNVNIVIADKGQQQPQIPAGLAAMGVKPPMPPMPPQGAPAAPGGAPPMPTGSMPPMGAPGAPQIPPQMMPRKRGGRTVDMEYGAGGGLGRLEKIKEYGDQ